MTERMRASEHQLRTWMVGGLGGDGVAHGSLLRALVPLLGAFFRRRLTDDGAVIDDLVQETLIAVHTRRATYDARRPFTAWLYAIARYKMIDHFRRAGRYYPMESMDDMLVSEGFEAASGATIDTNRLLGTLPPKQAAAIRATRIEGLSVAEAAQAADISESDVKVSVHRGLKALSARIRGKE